MTKATAKKIHVKDDVTTLDRAVLCFSEFLGTATLVFLGCQGCISLAGSGVPHLNISLGFGLAVMLSVQCFGHISGSHINPAVTVASAILGHIPLINVPIYMAGQFLGAFAGFGLLKAVTPSEIIKAANSTAPGACSPPHLLVTPGQACLNEFILTFLLIVVCAAVWDCRNTDKHDSLAIRFGLVIAVLALTGGPYSGANMNPARSFAPAIMNGDMNNHWVWWVGPLGGSVVGAVLYRFIFSKEGKTFEINNGGAEVHPLQDKA